MEDICGNQSNLKRLFMRKENASFRMYVCMYVCIIVVYIT